MPSAQIDKILSIYKQVAQCPSIVSAKIISATQNAISVQSRWSQRNLERRKKQKFVQDFSFTKNLELIATTFPADVSFEIITITSKDETLKAILRDVTVDGKSKQFIEIWDKKHFIKSYDLSAFDVHGDVYSDGNRII